MALSQRRRLALLIACLAGLAGPGSAAARAQTPPGPDTGGPVTIELVAQPVWHEPSDPLDLQLRISNRGPSTLRGFQLTVAAGSLLRSRTALHETFTGATGLSSFNKAFTDRELAAGERAIVSVDDPVTEFASLSESSEAGVYPMTVSVFEEGGFAPLDTVTTHLLLYPSRPENPLYAVPLLPINDLPSRGPDGSFMVDDITGSSRLEAALAADGWMTAIVDAVDRWTTPPPAPPPPPPPTRNKRNQSRRARAVARRERREQIAARRRALALPDPLRIAIAPTGRVLDELADMAGGYRRLDSEERKVVEDDEPQARAAAGYMEQLRTILERPRVQPVLVPYGFPDIPSLVHNIPLETSKQLVEGERVVSETLGIDIGRSWIFPPAGRIDRPSLDALQTFGAEATFFSRESLDQVADPAAAGCPESTLSFVCPVRVESVGDPVEGYTFDADVQERLTGMATPGAGRLEMQHFFAETALIHAEQPGLTPRTLHTIIPSNWRPTPDLADVFFGGLVRAPWLSTVTPEEGLELGREPAERTIVAEIPELPRQPDALFFESIIDANELVGSFDLFTGGRGPGEMLARVRRNVLVAESRNWWTGPQLVETGRTYASETVGETTAEMKKVSVSVASQTTFTSRTGAIQLSFFNETGYPVNVQIALNSLDMEFDPSSFDREFRTGPIRLQTEATAKSSGTFPVEVRVQTPDGYTIATRSIQIRSTALNVVALMVTLGAVAFLILFYAARGVRRRRSRREEAATPSAP